MPSARKAVLVIQYRGTLYFGSQIQVEQPTIAGELLKAISRFSQFLPKLEFASRTDTGVHALGQVVSFLLPNNFPPVAQLSKIINSNLPDDIRVVRSFSKPSEFHARFSAKKRDYCYRIFHGKVENIENAWKSWHLPGKPSWNMCSELIEKLVNRENWEGFCPQPADNFGFLAKLDNISIKSTKSCSIIRFSGRRYLYKMLVLISGLLAAAALERINIKQALLIANSELLNTVAPAPAKGLCLLKVHYK